MPNFFNPGCDCCGTPDCTADPDSCCEQAAIGPYGNVPDNIDVHIPDVFSTRSGSGAPGYCDDPSYPCTNTCDTCGSIGGDYTLDLQAKPLPFTYWTWLYQELNPTCDATFNLANCNFRPLDITLKIEVTVQCNLALGCLTFLSVNLESVDPITGGCIKSEIHGGYLLMPTSTCGSTRYNFTGWPTSRSGILVCQKDTTGTAYWEAS